MAQTSLGVTIWSKWVGGGLKEARREIGQLEDRMRKVNSSFLLAQGRSSMLKTSMMALAPAVKTVAGVMAGTAASAGSGFIAAAAAGGIYAKVVGETVKRTKEMAAAGEQLSEAQQYHVKYTKELSKTWGEFLKANENETLVVANMGVIALTDGIKHLQPVMDMMTRSAMQSAHAFKDWMNRADGAARASQYIAVYGSSAFEDYAKTIRNVLAGLGFGFREALKNMDNMNKGVLGLSAQFRGWAEGGGFTRFFEWVAQNRGTVQAFFDALVAAFKNITSALGILGPLMLKIFTVILNFIAAMDPSTIVAFYLALLALKVISHISGLVLMLTTAVRGLAAALVYLQANPIVLAIIAIVAVFVILWTTVEGFRNFWKAAWNVLVQVAQWAWENVLKPVFNAIAAAATWVWENVLKPTFQYIADHWREWMAAARWAWDNILWPVFKAIGAAAVWLWENILRPVIDQIAQHWDGWMQTLRRIWEGVLKPVFLAIAEVATWLWETILRPVFSFIASHWDEICAAMAWVWNNVLRPMFHVIGEVVSFLWNTVLKVIFNAIGVAFRVMVEVIAFVWSSVLEPVFKAIWAVVEFLWNYILKPIFFLIAENFKIMVAIMKAIWDTVGRPLFEFVGSTITWLWENILRPTFSWIADHWDEICVAMKAVWETVLKPVWENMVSAFNWVKEKIGEGIDKIGEYWDKLKGLIDKPVRWIVDTVWNGGIVKGWNWINDLWGGNDIQPFNYNAGGGVSSGGGGGMQAFATGGPVRGRGTGTSDSIPARLSNGEHVWTAREVRAAGGHGGVAALRSAVLGGQAVRAMGSGPGFAEGGGFWDRIGNFFTAGHTSHQIAANVAPSLAGFTSFSDGLRGTIDGVTGFAQNLVGMAKGIGKKALDAVLDFVSRKLTPLTGSGMGWQQMWDIVRGAFPDATLTSAKRNTNDYHGSGNAIDVAYPMTEFGKAKMLELNRWIANRYPNSTELIHTPGINLKNGQPMNYSSETQAAHWNHVHWAMAGAGGGSISGTADGWRTLVMQELAHVGQSAGLTDLVLRRMQQESGGNARAINNWDVNAAAGTPSKGLMQVIDPTFNAYKNTSMHPNDIWDPAANIHAALNYAMSRYGSLESAFNRKGGYRLGTNGALSGWNWVGERGPELVKFRGGEKVLNEERLRMFSRRDSSDNRPLIDTGGAPLIDARGATLEAAQYLDRNTLPKLQRLIEQGVGRKIGG